MKIGFFPKGFYFQRGNLRLNVHYHGWLMPLGYNWRIRLQWYKYYWRRVLTLGRY